MPGGGVGPALVVCLLGVQASAHAAGTVYRALQSSAEGEALFRSGLGRAHVAEFEMPRVMYRLQAYMQEPAELISMSTPAIGMEFVAGSAAAGAEKVEQLREWLFTQTVAIRERASSVTMIYAGMADGHFVGYYNDLDSPTYRYTFRAVGTSEADSSEFVFAPYTDAGNVPTNFGKKPTCDAEASTDGSEVCPAGCDASAGCIGTANVHYELSSSCPGSTTEPCTPTNADGSAGCCDKNIRTYHTTTRGVFGVPTVLTSWTTYDPRTRPWYTEELARAADSGWSSVYVFSTSRKLGLTRTAKMKHDGSAAVDGVLAVDFELSSLSDFLYDALAGTSSWAYLVEVEGPDAGKLLATSFGAPMEDLSGERCSATGDLIDSSGAITRVLQADSIYASAVKLSSEGWRETETGEILTNTVPGNRTQGQVFEAVAKRIQLGNLQWLLVVGQDISCASNERWLLGQCDDCPEGQVPSDDRTCIVCGQEFPGTVSDENLALGLGVECVCPVGSYSVRQPGEPNTCRPCSSLTGSTVGALDKVIQDVPWDQASVCPGGATTDTKICPLAEVWIEIEEPAEGLNEYSITRVNLLRCPACVSTPCENISTFDRPDVSHIAVCKNHHEGFICADCETGYKAIQGECVECKKVDYQWMVVEVLTAASIGFFLLSKTWRNVCKPDDAPAVFKAMDISEDGFLEAGEVRALLIRMGNPIAASKMFNQTLSDMKGKNLYRGVKLSKQRSWLPKRCGGLDPPAKEVVEQLQLGSISMLEFIDWCRANQNKAIVSTFTFGVQTFGLIAAETSDFSLAELFNLDVNAAAKTCRMPNCGLFCGMMGMALMPLVGCIAIYVGIWFLSTQVTMVWEERDPQTGLTVNKYKGLPMGWHHLQQGIMQVFLFSFAPITRRCASLLMCRTVPNGPGSVTTRLVSDLSLECWTGSHMIAAVLAVILLLLFAVVAPIVLLSYTRERVNKRDQTHEDEPHATQPNRMRKASLFRPSSFLSYDRLDDTIQESIGLKNADQKVRSRLQAVPKLNPKAWDVLTMATRDTKYWWFIAILMLKLLVNAIFLVGKAMEYNWAMWLQITLMTAAFLSHYHHPYVLVSDNHQEQMTFLGLALTLSITNSGIVYSGTWRWFHVLVVLAVVFTITAYFAKIQYKSYYEKKDRTARVKKGEQNLTQFTREVFSAAVPTFLLLPDEDRHAIRLLLQVETFQKGDVLYHQGDVANAFYLIKEGSITLRTSLYDSSKELSSDANGDHYEQLAVGAGALLNKPQRRNATAVASSPTLVCLRIIRTDWLKYWTPITEKVAKQLFDSIDKNNNGFISADELRSKLSARWTQVSEEENKKVGSKESTAFNEQLLKSTVDRLINLMDVDRSGTIEFAELMKTIRNIPADDLQHWTTPGEASQVLDIENGKSGLPEPSPSPQPEPEPEPEPQPDPEPDSEAEKEPAIELMP